MENVKDTVLIEDFSEILKVYGLSYSAAGYYWQVGQPPRTQGWIIHLSVIKAQLQEFLQLLVPELLIPKVPFKIIRDWNTAVNLLEGAFGYEILGKMVTIYPEDDRQANALAKRLIKMTGSYRGPAIPTDRYLGGIVYTRYGAFTPILIKNNFGDLVIHIYNAAGDLVPDPYDIPFKMPEGRNWPFADITSQEAPKSGKLLNYKYYPLFVLKADLKGDVIKALYFKKAWNIKSCLIKQGRPNTFSDQYGRDIQDRLKWQHTLYQSLHTDIPMPKIFDYFKENESTYLAMEFIKGRTLTTWLQSVHKDRCWRHLETSDRLLIISKLLTILAIISRLHDKGYVHRDITPENFLILPDGKIYLIDMELTWTTNTVTPQPPFGIGTSGHTSPEQLAGNTPTFKEDIYGIGGLLFLSFTGLHAPKYKGQSLQNIKRLLTFLTNDIPLSKLMASCWSKNPLERPDLIDIILLLKIRHDEPNNNNKIGIGQNTYNFSSLQKQLENIIQHGLNYLASPQLLSVSRRWFSLSMQKETHIGNPQSVISIYEGWHTGISGPLWLTALAKMAGFSIDACHEAYFNNFEFIKQDYFSETNNMSAGLFAGNAGIVLALSEGLNSGMLTYDSAMFERLQRCFSLTAVSMDLSEGIAGQGIALLQCAPWLDKLESEKLLISYVRKIAEAQLFDGSWNTYTGLNHGAAGILLFLLSYLEVYQDSTAKTTALKALTWLQKVNNGTRKHYSCPINTRTKLASQWNTSMGIPGVALAFITAYKVFRDSSYRDIVENCLSNIPAHPVIMDFSLGYGLSGLGEVYLEAYKHFKNPIWQERANWIAELLLHFHRNTSNESESDGWLTSINEISTADLFVGNSGILHFLMRVLNPKKIKHPFIN